MSMSMHQEQHREEPCSGIVTIALGEQFALGVRFGVAATNAEVTFEDDYDRYDVTLLSLSAIGRF